MLDFQFSKFQIFNGQKGQDSRGSTCVTVPNCMAISQTIAEIWRFFRFFKMVAAALLDFQNLDFLTVKRVDSVTMHHAA